MEKSPRKGIADLKKRIGVPLRIKLYNEEASIDAIRHFAHGIGDPNEMWDKPRPRASRAPTAAWWPADLPLQRPLASGILAGGLPAVQLLLRRQRLGILSHY